MGRPPRRPGSGGGTEECARRTPRAPFDALIPGDTRLSPNGIPCREFPTVSKFAVPFAVLPDCFRGPTPLRRTAKAPRWGPCMLQVQTMAAIRVRVRA